MLVSTAIANMAHAELKQVSVRNDEAAMISMINRAILELHKRFIMWQAEATITAVLGVDTYTMSAADPNVAIDLSDHIFLRVDAVYDDTGLELRLNDEKDPFTVATPRWNKLQFPEITADEDGAEFSVIYRASPIDLTAPTDEIGLPPQLNEAMYLYCTYLAFVSINGDEKAENNTHYKRFEAELQKIDFENLLPKESMDSNKFDDRGFV